MAGLGESCSHVAALLFTVDTMVKVRDSTTVTQKPAYWKQPGFKEVAYARAHEMDFTSSQMKKKRLDHDSVANSVKSKPGSGRSSAKDIPPLTAAEVARIHQRISFPNSGVKPALLSLVAGFEGDYITHSTSTLPAILVDVKKGDIDKHLTVTHEQVALAEEKTRGQAQCKLWHRLRIGRITASNLHAVTRTDPANPSKSVLRQICNPVGVNSPALEWGRQNEAKALEKYKRIFSEIHSNFQEKRCGLYISTECSFVGASPDGMRQCDCCGTGCVEVKCPYATRNLTIDEAIDNRKDFCLFKSADGCFVLKKNHPYYLQVQCQIFVTKSEFCDFVVCTESDLVAVKVLPDRDAWEEALEKAKVFFNMCILPIIVSSDDSESEQSGESVASESDGKSVVHESAGKSVVHESAGGSAVHESGEESAVHEPHSVVLSPSKKRFKPNSENSGSDTENERVPLYCFCRDIEHGKMIYCDNENCPYSWFHFDCVKLKRAPKERWYCPECKQLPQYRSGKTLPKEKTQSTVTKH